MWLLSRIRGPRHGPFAVGAGDIAGHDGKELVVAGRIGDLADERGLDRQSDALVGVVCECPNLDCTASIELTVAEYEDVRFHADRFAIAPEHDVPQLEMVVAKNEYYWAVERSGKAADAATEIYLNEPPETG